MQYVFMVTSRLYFVNLISGLECVKFCHLSEPGFSGLVDFQDR